MIPIIFHNRGLMAESFVVQMATLGNINTDYASSSWTYQRLQGQTVENLASWRLFGTGGDLAPVRIDDTLVVASGYPGGSSGGSLPELTKWLLHNAFEFENDLVDTHGTASIVLSDSLSFIASPLGQALETNSSRAAWNVGSIVSATNKSIAAVFSLDENSTDRILFGFCGDPSLASTEFTFGLRLTSGNLSAFKADGAGTILSEVICTTGFNITDYMHVTIDFVSNTIALTVNDVYIGKATNATAVPTVSFLQIGSAWAETFGGINIASLRIINSTNVYTWPALRAYLYNEGAYRPYSEIHLQGAPRTGLYALEYDGSTGLKKVAEYNNFKEMYVVPNPTADYTNIIYNAVTYDIKKLGSNNIVVLGYGSNTQSSLDSDEVALTIVNYNQSTKTFTKLHDFPIAHLGAIGTATTPYTMWVIGNHICILVQSTGNVRTLYAYLWNGTALSTVGSATLTDNELTGSSWGRFAVYTAKSLGSYIYFFGNSSTTRDKIYYFDGSTYTQVYRNNLATTYTTVLGVINDSANNCNYVLVDNISGSNFTILKHDLSTHAVTISVNQAYNSGSNFNGVAFTDSGYISMQGIWSPQPHAIYKFKQPSTVTLKNSSFWPDPDALVIGMRDCREVGTLPALSSAPSDKILALSVLSKIYDYYDGNMLSTTSGAHQYVNPTNFAQSKLFSRKANVANLNAVGDAVSTLTDSPFHQQEINIAPTRGFSGYTRDFDPTRGVSMCMFFTPNTLNTIGVLGGIVCGSGTDAEVGLHIYHSATGELRAGHAGTTTYNSLNSGISLTNGVRSFVQADFDISTGQLRVRKDNGAFVTLATQASYPTSLGNATEYLTVGLADPVTNTRGINGKISKIGFFNDKLTDAEWNYLYNGGLGKSYNQMLIDSGVDTAYYKY